MRNIIILSLAVVICAGVCGAQTQFARAIGGTSSDGASSVIQTNDGGYAVAGLTNSFGAGNYDFFLVKFSSTGAVEWSKAVGGTSGDLARSVVQTSDGGYAVAGVYQYNYYAETGNFFLVKFSSTGSVSWARTVGGTNMDYGKSVVQASDGGYVVAGWTLSFGAGSYDLFLVKFSSSGAVEWSKTVGGTNWEGCGSFVQTSDGGYAVTGWTNSFGAGNYDFLLVKLSSTGTVEWAKVVGGTSDDRGKSVVQASDGGYVVAGQTQSFGPGGWDLYFVKFTSTGSVTWSKAVGGTGGDYCNSVVQASDGGYAVAGRTYSFGEGEDDLFLVKFSSTGSVEWSRIVGGTERDDGNSVVQTSDGGLAVAGGTQSFGAGGDLFLVKFDSEGNTCIGEEAFPIVTDVSPSFASPSPVVTSPSPTITDVSPTVTDVTPTVTEICTDDIVETIIKPQGIEISVNPNPFNSSVAITAPEGAEVEIYDLRGTLRLRSVPDAAVAELAEATNGSTGSPTAMRTFIWTPDETIASGIYLVKAKKDDGQTAMKKIILLR